MALNVVAGDFSKGLELLRNQLSVANFEPMKHLFVDAHTLGKIKLQTLPHGPEFNVQLRTSP